ncbi:MAG TPA: hypothetical protein DIC64_04510 [Alphaproteobacteria bacterium]|nr:hypothetical protein [Alphaproteobacteria bacterium]
MPNTLEDIENAFCQYAILRLKGQRKESAKSKATSGLTFSPYLISRIKSFEYDMDSLQRYEFDYESQIGIFKSMKEQYCSSENPSRTEKNLSLLLTKRIYQAKQKQKKKDEFHNLIIRFHHPKNVKDKIKTALNLYKKVGEYILGDIPSNIKGGRPRVYAEFKRDTAEILSQLYSQNALNAEQFGSNEKDFKNASLDWEAQRKRQQEIMNNILEKFSIYTEHQAGHPFGPQGAFAKGGLYGPDSKFAVNTLHQQNAPKLQTPKYQMPPVSQPSKTQETVVELSLFSDKDFEY